MSERTSRWAAPAVALLALASSIVGLVNQFTYDDRYIVELNPVVHSLAEWWKGFGASYWPRMQGGDGYRPITILAFKIEYAIGGGHPMAFHAANILLYAAASLLVYQLAKRVFASEHRWVAWLAAALFAVHPVHVEAVANVVGQSELIVGIALLGATVLYLRDRAEGPLRWSTAAWIALLYAVACFAKEHGIVLPAILVAAEATLLARREPWRVRIPQVRPFYLVLALVAVAFMAARSLVLADRGIVGFEPFTPFSALRVGTTDRMLTAIGVVPQWLRLLFWPAHLASEYGPPDIEIAQGLSISQIPGAALLAAVITFAIVLRRRQPEISFGIAVAGITLLPSSNLLVPAGIVLAERTLFLPSVGAVLVVSAVAALVAQRRREWFEMRGVRVAAQSLIALVLVAGVARSLQRTTVWRENDRLFRQAVIDSPFAYRAHFMLGAWHFQNKRKRDGEAAYRHALNLFPYDPFLSYTMAEQYREVGLCGPALPLYRWTFGLRPQFRLGRGAFARCLLMEGQYAEARTWAFDAIRFGANVRDMRRVIFITDSIAAVSKPSPVAQTNAAGKVPETVQKTARSTRDHQSVR